MVRLVGLEPTTGKTPVDFKPTAYANFATAAPATRQPENITRGNHPHNLSRHAKMTSGPRTPRRLAAKLALPATFWHSVAGRHRETIFYFPFRYSPRRCRYLHNNSCSRTFADQYCGAAI